MSEDKSRSTDKQKTNDQLSNSPSLDYPLYLQTVKQNLQLSLPFYNVMIIQKKNEQSDDQEEYSGLFSIVLTSPKVYKNKYQIFTEALLDQNCYCFYIRHLILIQNKQSISMALNFCNKINKQMENLRLIIDPVSGKIYFETKSFINQSSLTSLKKHILRQDCFYTEIIYCSVRKSQKYIEIILFLLGQISLCELVTNNTLSKQFRFLKQSHQIIQRLDKNICYINFLDMDEQKKVSNQLTTNFQRDWSYNFLKNWKQSKDQLKKQQKQQIDHKQQKILRAKNEILNNSLQYFSQNTQKTISFFLKKNLYSNIDFSIKPLRFDEQSLPFEKTIVDIQKRPSVQTKRILSFIEVVQVQQPFFSQEQNEGWKVISEGGFGIIELGTVKYKNLSTSYKEPDTGFSLIIKQQIIRKRDRNYRKNKIQRQRKILQKLQYYTHPNIMSFYLSFQYQYQNCIFSDYTPNMSLDLYLKKNQYIASLNQKISFLIQSIQGLSFLHQQKIVHLDIKPGNMLINKHLRLLLADFGQAFVIGQDDPVTHNHAYTIPYCAPQIFLQRAELTVKADIYAIGVCIFKVILGELFMETFLRRKFIKRLGQKQIENIGIGQKYERSFLYPIFKIIFLIAYRAVNEVSDRRPQLSWIVQILTQCRNFIFTLIY